MRPPIAPFRAIALLVGLVVNAALLICIGMEVMSDGSTDIDKPDWKADLTGSIANPAVRKPLEKYAVIFTHPVFFRTRAPYVAPPAAPPPMTAPLVIDPGFVVTGVIITNGVSEAYISSKASPGAGGTWTREGEAFLGWQIRSINADGVKLEQNGRSLEVQLYPPN